MSKPPVIYHLTSHSNMGKHHITTVLPEALIYWLLIGRKQLIHLFFTDVIAIFFRLIHQGVCWMHMQQFRFMSQVFWTAMLFDDGCSFRCFFVTFMFPAYFIGTSPRHTSDSRSLQLTCTKSKQSKRTHIILYF